MILFYNYPRANDNDDTDDAKQRQVPKYDKINFF